MKKRIWCKIDPDLKDCYEKSMLRWFKHFDRMNKERLTKQIVESVFNLIDKYKCYMDENDDKQSQGKDLTARTINTSTTEEVPIVTRVPETSSDSSSSHVKRTGYKRKQSKSRSRSKSLSSSNSGIHKGVGGSENRKGGVSSHQSSVGYGSGDKPSSRAWSKDSNSDDYRKPKPDSMYYSGTNYNASKVLANEYHTCITAALDNLKEDIMYTKHAIIDHPHRLTTISEAVSASGGEGNVGNQQIVYMEGRGGGFVPTSRSVALKNNTKAVWLEQVSELDSQTPLDLAIIIQKVFAPISTISFGLLGGVALMQSFMSYTYLHNRNSIDDMFTFIESYNIFAKVAPTAFYILLAICIVAIFDRFDLAHLDVRQCADTLLYRHGWFLLVLYVITLVLTLCTAELDDMLLLYPHDKEFTMNQQDLFYRLSQWHTLNVFRCVFAMLGWFIMAISQPDDLLLEHLKSIKQFDLIQPKEIFVVGSPSSIRHDEY